MTQLLAIGPFEMVLSVGFIGVGVLVLYGVYRIGYRVGRAEGALADRDRSAR